MNVAKTLLLPVIVYCIFYLTSGGKFGTPASLASTMRNTVQSLIMAWGLMFILGANMWDFSGGAQIFLTALTSVQIITNLNLGAVGVVMLLVVLNVVMRAVVGLIYTVVRAPSMVVTLALCMIFESICKFVFGYGAVLNNPNASMIADAPWCFLLLAIVAVFTVFFWNYTQFSYHVRALGSGEKVARNIGLQPMTVRFKVFLVQGVYLGCAAAMLLGTRGNVQAPVNLSSFTLVFDALMTVFIGTALEKYSNRIIGVAVGAVVMKMITSGLLASGVNSAWQMTITGIFLALFIGISTNLKRISQYFANRKRAAAANEKFAQVS